jgi:DNA-binding winged helix-turn-helix (wHTH) protein
MADRVAAHFEDIWSKLPAEEQDALSWLAIGARPDAADALAFDQALPSLERRGYVVDGRIFSEVFAQDVQRRLTRVELNADTGDVRIEKRAVDLSPKEFALLRFLLEQEGDVVAKDEIAAAVWPEYRKHGVGVTDSMIQKAISRLRKEVDGDAAGFQHIESIRGQGYRFQNASVFEYYHQLGEREGVADADPDRDPQEAGIT